MEENQIPKTAFYDFPLKEERERNVLAVKSQVETVAVIVAQRRDWHRGRRRRKGSCVLIWIVEGFKGNLSKH